MSIRIARFRKTATPLMR